MRTFDTILDIEGGAEADLGVGYGDGAFADTTMDAAPAGGRGGGGGKFFQTGEGKAAFAIWVGSVVWLVLVWRAVEGY